MNYISITPTYTPFTLDELLTIPREYRTAYKDMDEKLDKLAEINGDYEFLARSNPNLEASKAYLQFVDELNRASESLSTTGMTRENVALIGGLKKKFNSASQPFKRAVAVMSEIDKQRAKDANKGIIGDAPTFEYLLEHPEYTAQMDRNSYLTAAGVTKTAQDLFKGLDGFDRTPQQTQGPDGYWYSYTPQSYTSEQISNAFDGIDGPGVTEELKKAVEAFKQRTNYDSMDESNQALLKAYGIAGASSVQNKDSKPQLVKPKSSGGGGDGSGDSAAPGSGATITYKDIAGTPMYIHSTQDATGFSYSKKNKNYDGSQEYIFGSDGTVWGKNDSKNTYQKVLDPNTDDITAPGYYIKHARKQLIKEDGGIAKDQDGNTIGKRKLDNKLGVDKHISTKKTKARITSLLNEVRGKWYTVSNITDDIGNDAPDLTIVHNLPAYVVVKQHASAVLDIYKTVLNNNSLTVDDIILISSTPGPDRFQFKIAALSFNK